MRASNFRFALIWQIGYEKNEAGEKPGGNHGNGNLSKTLRTRQEPMEIFMPWDHDWDFEPRITGKHQEQRCCHGMAGI
jgi:transposase-like protein